MYKRKMAVRPELRYSENFVISDNIDKKLRVLKASDAGYNVPGVYFVIISPREDAQLEIIETGSEFLYEYSPVRAVALIKSSQRAEEYVAELFQNMIIEKHAETTDADGKETPDSGSVFDLKGFLDQKSFMDLKSIVRHMDI